MSRVTVDEVIVYGGIGGVSPINVNNGANGSGYTVADLYTGTSPGNQAIFRAQIGNASSVGAQLVQMPGVMGVTGAPIDTNAQNPVKIVMGNGVLPTYAAGSGEYISQVTITLSGAAVFTSSASYRVVATLRTNGANSLANIQVTVNSASSFTLYSVSPSLIGSGSVDYMAIGY